MGYAIERAEFDVAGNEVERYWMRGIKRILFKATVAASETYNTALEQHLRDSLGLRFAERPDQDIGKRPIREIVGATPL